MKQEAKEKFWSKMLSGSSLKSATSSRQKSHIFESIPIPLVETYINDGWEVDKEFKTKMRMKKLKSPDLAFEDSVWATFANLGFEYLNSDRSFKVPYSDDYCLTQQIDVFAADRETILIIECKSTQGEPKKGNFKETIEAIGGKKAGIIKSIKSFFPNSKQKIKFILATNNYYLSEPDKERLEKFDIIHFDEDIITYYQELTKHLGLSAKYQLLGGLFEGQTIPELDNRIPAIQGKLGGHTYYSFSIEPEKLLKIGYVLHRNKANVKLMPTYQRLIKKTRLKSVQDFIDNGGFFPNSIIINVDNKGKKLKFDQASPQVEDAISKIGILHLPKNYRSAYIIDGQHRLYGYANSEYKSKNSIPVVAFVDLDRREQVKVFMQINENQKAVPKNLKNTLNADLLWDSESLDDRIKALKLQLAQGLGEEKFSPLYDRVIIGENNKTPSRCITIDTINNGLNRSNFFGSFSKVSIKADGTFYKGNNEETYNSLLKFLTGSFAYIKEQLYSEWIKGEEGDGFLAINAGIESLIRIFSDIIDLLVKDGTVATKIDKADTIVEETKYYLDPLIDFLKSLPLEKKIELRKSYGTAGRVKYWRLLQKAINNARPEFKPDGLNEYWKDEEQAFNEESFKMIRDLETFMKEDFKKKLEIHFGENWFKKGIPQQLYIDSITLAAKKNIETESDSEEVQPWDCLHIIDYRKIAQYGKNWSEIFEKSYTKPGEEKISGGKEAKTKWMQKLEKIRNQNFHSYSVKEEEYTFLKELHDWLIKSGSKIKPNSTALVPEVN